MSARAGIVVTGTEVLTGQISDLNGPWVTQRLLELGVDVAHITICGDRPDDLTAQLRFLAGERVDLIITTGGLGPTADDLTVATVADFCDRPISVDDDLEAHIAGIIRRWRGITAGDESPSMLAGIHKQAVVPQGAQPIPPTGTAPGIAIPATDTIPAILILPGPPQELRAMWPTAIEMPAIADAISGRIILFEGTIRAYGLLEAELAETLRAAEKDVDGFDDLEITTCLRRGEVEIVTRFDEKAVGSYSALAEFLTTRHGSQIFSTDGATIDDQLAELLTGRTVVTAESCTGGMVAARLTDRPGSSAYVLGGVVAYANDVKAGVIDVPTETLDEFGAVSEQVAAAMAEGAMRRLGADTAVSTTGVAGPGGGTDLKPVGMVCFGVAVKGRPTVTATRRFPGDRASVRALSTTTAMHLLARELRDAVASE